MRPLLLPLFLLLVSPVLAGCTDPDPDGGGDGEPEEGIDVLPDPKGWFDFPQARVGSSVEYTSRNDTLTLLVDRETTISLESGTKVSAFAVRFEQRAGLGRANGVMYLDATDGRPVHLELESLDEAGRTEVSLDVIFPDAFVLNMRLLDVGGAMTYAASYPTIQLVPLLSFLVAGAEFRMGTHDISFGPVGAKIDVWRSYGAACDDGCANITFRLVDPKNHDTYDIRAVHRDSIFPDEISIMIPGFSQMGQRFEKIAEKPGNGRMIPRLNATQVEPVPCVGPASPVSDLPTYSAGVFAIDADGLRDAIQASEGFRRFRQAHPRVDLVRAQYTYQSTLTGLAPTWVLTWNGNDGSQDPSVFEFLWIGFYKNPVGLIVESGNHSWTSAFGSIVPSASADWSEVFKTSGYPSYERPEFVWEKTTGVYPQRDRLAAGPGLDDEGERRIDDPEEWYFAETGCKFAKARFGPVVRA